VVGLGSRRGELPPRGQAGVSTVLIKIIDLDVNTPPVSPMSLEDLSIPAPLIRDQLLAELTDAVGADNVVQDDLDRCARQDHGQVTES
jgi:hypothetical protein